MSGVGGQGEREALQMDFLSNNSQTFTHLTMDNIIKEAFLTACSDVEFHGRWMTLDTWAELICLCFNLINSHSFTGIDLNKIFQSKSNSNLSTQMDFDHRNVPKDHIGIFQDRYHHPKRTTRFYACEKGKAPKTTAGTKWFHEGDDAKDLKLNLKEKHILVVNNVIVSKNLNKQK